MNPFVTNTLVHAAQRLGKLLIRLKIWIPLRTALDMMALVQEWRYESDEKKRELILRRINRKFADRHIEVDVKDGVVRLNGSAENWEQVVAIGQAAGKNVPGIWGVVNRVSSPDTNAKPVPQPLAEIKGPILGEFDVVIVGAGVIGAAIARELSKFELNIAVVEKAADTATGQTKANSGMIHPALNPHYGSLMHKLNLRGRKLYPSVCEELGVALKKCGMLAVVTRPEEAPLLEAVYIKGKLNGEEELRVLTAEELAEFEPRVSHKNYGALYCGTAAVVRPYEVNVAYAENAAENGVRFFFNHEVTGIVRDGRRVTAVVTQNGTFKAGMVINAAGVASDQIAAMAGAEEFTIHPRRGEVVVFDRDTEGYVNHVVGELTLKKSGDSKGGGIMVTVDGNILFGPSAQENPETEDKSTHREAIGGVIDKFQRLTPDFPADRLITTFTGIRAASYTEDFIIRWSGIVDNLLHVAGIQSPGLASAPAIAEMVEGLVKEKNMSLKRKSDWQPRHPRRAEFSRLPEVEQDALIAKDPSYAHVICRCEGVTEHEVREACHGPLPADTIDGVKRRTRAGMGRCQGGFCSPYVAKIISQERGIPILSVTKDGPGSELFVSETKEGSNETR